MKYEIRPIKLVDNNYEHCAETDPDAVWGLYEIGEDKLPTHVSDHPTREDAERAMADLTD